MNRKLQRIHSEALAEFDDIQSALRAERDQCLEDRRFYSIAGAQWEGSCGELFENKPRLEMNKIHLAIMSIINEYRNNRITVNFVPKDGSSGNKTADTCNGLYRADEQDSCAEEAYDNAFEEAVGGGFGAWRLRTAYEDEEDEDDERQRVKIEPIFDADSSVYFDLNAKRQDKSDAKCCFVLYSIPLDRYMEEYDDDPQSWDKITTQAHFDWCSPDVVYLAEYYVIEEKPEVVKIFRGLDGSEVRHHESYLLENTDVHDELLALGHKEVRQKKIKRKRVHKYIMSGGKVLEDCGYIAGKHIPIIPVYGKRWFVDNIERCMGHVRMSKDAQRLKNMQISQLAEISALFNREKPILTPDQIAGHQMMWSDDNIKNYPYLLINPTIQPDGSEVPGGPAAYTRAPNVPPAMAALLQVTDQDIRDLLGNQDAAEQVVSHVSGKAVEMIQNKVGLHSFIYMSNMAKAIKRSGEVWLSIAKEIFVEPNRKMKSISYEGKPSQVELLRPNLDPETGAQILENDLSEADLDVAVDVGPSNTSKRQSIVRSLTGMMQFIQDPETAQVVTAMAMMNMEGEGLADVRDYFRKKMVSAGVVKPTEEEMAQMQAEAQNAQPDPQAQYLQAAAEEAAAKAENMRANTMLTGIKAEETKAKTEETRAKTIATLASVEQSDRAEIREERESLAGRGKSSEGTT
jgi:hypothetical protein